MNGISVGHSHPRPCRGKKTLRRCRNNEEADNIILIDVDSEKSDNVIVIDIPESLPKKNQGSSMLRKDKKWSFSNVINIDDDEITDSCCFIGVNSVGVSAGTSSSGESFHVTENFGDSVDAAFEGCQFVQDSATPVRLSKCKRTYSGKAFRINCYGLDSDSEFDATDNDYPDCELVEDSTGKVQEMWEKAYSKRRKGFYNGHSDIRDHDINKDYQQHTDLKGATCQPKESSSCSTIGEPNNENDASSPFRTKEDINFGCTNLSDEALYDQQQDKSCSFGPIFQARHCTSIHDEQADYPSCEQASSCYHNEERRKDSASSSFVSQEKSTKKSEHPIPIVEDEETSKVEPCPNSATYVDKDSCNCKSSHIAGDSTEYRSDCSPETEVNKSQSFPRDVHKNIQEMAAAGSVEEDHLKRRQSPAAGGAKKMENLMPERCSFERSSLPGKQTDHSFTSSCDAVDVSGECLLSKSFLPSGEGKKGDYKESRPLVPEILLFETIHLNEAKLLEACSVSDIQQQVDKDGQLHGQNEDTLPHAETCIINEREKLKETVEYKRAVEKEWASRQQALRLQAEEAKSLRQLRKRRTAEALRLLDMERRQKQRLEEMRSIQKKDEENMNLKEIIRAEVRKELNKLEIVCHNMANLLHLLGVRVGSWPNPSPQEVQTAYRRALLAFHPDRASRYDIRQLVEAEEKFKLIILLKEKFLPS